MKAPEPANEAARLQALRAYKVLDSETEHAFDDLTLLAAHICKVPIAVISLVDEARQWFKSRFGVDISETPRDVAFCAHAILSPGPLIVKNATQDERFARSPLVTEPPQIRFYAGFPLVTQEGFALGTLCAIDRVPRELTPDQQKAMTALARQVMALLEFRRVSTALAESLEQVKTLHGLLPICAWCKRIRDDRGYWTQVEAYLQQNMGADFTHGICPQCLEKRYPQAAAKRSAPKPAGVPKDGE